MVSDIVAAVIFSTMLDPTLGSLNYFIGCFGLPGPNWIGDPKLVILTLALVDTWWQTGNIILILLAGLTSIPQDRIDMASIDGASGWKMLRPHHAAGAEAVHPRRSGIPDHRCAAGLRARLGHHQGRAAARATEVSQLYIFKQGIGQFFNMGYASAAATLFAILVGLDLRRLSAAHAEAGAMTTTMRGAARRSTADRLGQIASFIALARSPRSFSHR